MANAATASEVLEKSPLKRCLASSAFKKTQASIFLKLLLDCRLALASSLLDRASPWIARLFFIRLPSARDRECHKRRASFQNVDVVRMTTLILKHANKNRLDAIEWCPNDFDVCDGDRCIGRIFLSAQAPQGRPWFWTSLRVSTHRRHTVAATQRHASKRCTISKRSGLTDFVQLS
jgi:hypothetical protein